MAEFGGINIGDSQVDEQSIGGINVGTATIDKPDFQTLGGFVRGVNKGMAEGFGGLVDFVNPFDEPILGLPGTGSAVEGITNVFEAISEGSTQDTATGLLGEAASGTGQAISAIAPVAKGLQALKSVGGAVGAFADDALVALNSIGGFAGEAIAGGTSKAAEAAAKDAGAGPGLAATAGIVAGGLSVPAALGAPRAAASLAAKTPGASFVGRQVRDLQRGLLPMTDAGAREQAATRLRGLVGGEERAAELSRLIDPNEPLGLTPAQQTGDPNLLGLERAAAAEQPLVRERLAARAESGQEAAREGIEALGGDVGDARAFFADRLRTFKTDMTNKIDEAVQSGDLSVEGAAPRISEGGASERAVERVRGALDVELGRERELWNAVPVEAEVSTQSVRDTLANIVETTPRAQQDDIPAIARRLLSRTDGSPADPSQIGDTDTVSELHGLYSELRRVSRSAVSGTNQNKNLARISNELADSILRDLGAVDASSPAGIAINEARTFSRALNETFNQGAVGKILQRTIGGDEAIPPEIALRRTVGAGGPGGEAAAADIQRAAPEAGEDVGEFLRGRFVDAVNAPDGKFTPAAAERFMRNNRELLAANPELNRELRRALGSRNAAARFAVRNQARQKLIDAESAPARFNLGQEEKSILSIISADDPKQAATSVVNAARKDPTGSALAGVKAAFTNHLVTGENITGQQMKAMLSDKNMRQAMNQVFSTGEMGRLNQIATSLGKMNPGEVNAVSDVIDASSNRLLEMVVRISAAQRGGSLGGGSLGGSMQTANIFVERSRQILRNLTNVKARELLTQAVEDPALFRDLLKTPQSVNLPASTRSRLAPFLIGAGAGQEANEGAQ